MKSFFLFFSLFVLNAATINAQSWQWGRRGGGNSNSTNPSKADDVVDMDVDPNGNLYIASLINSAPSATIDTAALTTYGGMDILIASYRCDGSLRWKKVIGSNNNDYNPLVKTDRLGHVYVAGALSYPQRHIGTDTSWNDPKIKQLFLAQFDTLGNFNWIRLPAPDTASIYSSNKFYAFDMYLALM